MPQLTADELTAIASAAASVATANYDYKIRRALIEAIDAVTTNTALHNRMKLLTNADNILSLFVSSEDSNRVHGWMVTRRRGDQGTQRSPGQPPTPAKVRRDNVYVIMGAHYYGFGDDTTNTEDTFGLECDKVVAAIDALGTIAGLPRRPMTYSLDLVPNGAALVHLFVGEIAIEFDYCA